METTPVIMKISQQLEPICHLPFAICYLPFAIFKRRSNDEKLAATWYFPRVGDGLPGG